MTLFTEQPIGDYTWNKLESLKREVDSFPEIDSVEETASGLVKKFSLPNVKFEAGEYDTTINIENVAVNHNRGEMSRDGRKNVAVVNYSYKVNYTPNQVKVLGLRPSVVDDQRFTIIYGGNPQAFKFGIETTYSNAKLTDSVIEEVKQIRDQVLTHIVRNIEFLNADIERINAAILKAAHEYTEAKKIDLDQIRDIHSKL